MLDKKVAIVTGGTRGIGLETVRVFKENNAEVILFGSKEESVSNAINLLKSEGIEVTGYYPNLNNYFEIESTLKEIIKKYGHIDILVNNAGISAKESIENTTSEDFAKIIDLNVQAVFNMTKAVVPYMKENKSGVILNIKMLFFF